MYLTPLILRPSQSDQHKHHTNILEQKHSQAAPDDNMQHQGPDPWLARPELDSYANQGYADNQPHTACFVNGEPPAGIGYIPVCLSWLSPNVEDSVVSAYERVRPLIEAAKSKWQCVDEKESSSTCIGQEA